jgi:hypothetical protein
MPVLIKDAYEHVALNRLAGIFRLGGAGGDERRS